MGKPSRDAAVVQVHGFGTVEWTATRRAGIHRRSGTLARGSVHNAGSVARTRKMFKRAFQSQLRGEGFTFVEVLTMCPTGWFIPTADGPTYMTETLGEVHIMGELKVDGRIRTTEELHADNVAKQRELDEQLARGGIDD